MMQAAGDVDPNNASNETLRGRYGVTVEDNRFHCSLSYPQALLEKEIFEVEEDDKALIVPKEPEKVCLVACANRLKPGFYYEFFDLLERQGFELKNFKVAEHS